MKIDDLNNILRSALKNNNKEIVNYSRNLKAKIEEYLVEKRLPRNDVPDDVVEKVAKSYSKLLLKAVEDMERGLPQLEEEKKANAESIINSYKEEAEFSNQFLPQKEEITADKIKELVEQAIIEVGEDNIGKIIGCIMKNNKSLDGSIVKRFVVGMINERKNSQNT